MKNVLLLLACCVLAGVPAMAQNILYPDAFPLHDVQLLPGPWQQARDLNVDVLLQYDVDRLLYSYRQQAGLATNVTGYPNWDGLDGHIAGHYLSALAMTVAATGHAACRERMLYIIAELAACQAANSSLAEPWRKGYVGGVPNSAAVWSGVQAGSFDAYRAAWVPWYNVHKMYAGLRDAWVYTGNAEAGRLFLGFCDWGIAITAGLSNAQMQTMLDTEHGGMNEIYADAYQRTHDLKYLQAARRFSHDRLLLPLAQDVDDLDNKHANTQVPKAVGFQRIGALTHDPQYEHAGSFFWHTVTSHRTVAFGGNSRREFFPAPAACSDFIHDVEGPESCNSYNMLKLTEDLFGSAPSAKYVDYYERTLFNHIRSTQHPVTGGYVYFTPLRPRHYRVYSAPQQAMWCCVGSGMESHAKYNQFIYRHRHDSLYVNLFIASEVTWQEKGITLTQTTNFPYEAGTTLRVTAGTGEYTLMLRHPAWVKAGDFTIRVNGKPVAGTSTPSSFVAIRRRWKKGDIVTVQFQMQTQVERLPNVPHYVAILHGPIVLAAATGREDLRGLVADDGRWAHIAGGTQLPITEAPILLENDPGKIARALTPVKGKPLTFTLSGIDMVQGTGLVLEPFAQLHDTRYALYWLALSPGQHKSYRDSLATLEQHRLAIQKRTVDFVAAGEQQPEADHDVRHANSRTGNTLNTFWRDAGADGYFSYTLSTRGETDLRLRVRYWGAEWGNRKFDIVIDDKKLVTEDNTGRWNQSQFFDVEYTLPPSMLQGKEKIALKFQALPQNTAGAVYYIRLVRPEAAP